MQWESISVNQFQEIHRLSLNTKLDDMDKLTNAICILFNKTEAEVDDLTIPEFNRLAKECTFLFVDQIPGKPVKSIRIGTKKYAIQYDPKLLKYRQYVEILKFSEKPIENMHYIMASLVNPVRFGIKRKNKVEDHLRISQDMLEAPVMAVYHSAVFFCKLYTRLIEAIRASLEMEMTRKGMTKDQATMLINNSRNAMAGFIQPERSQHLKG